MSLPTSNTSYRAQTSDDSCFPLNEDLLKGASPEERLEHLVKEINMHHIAHRLRCCLTSVISSRLSLPQSNSSFSDTHYLGTLSNKQDDFAGASPGFPSKSQELSEDTYLFRRVETVHQSETGTVLSPICDIRSSSSKLIISSIRSTIRLEDESEPSQCGCSKARPGER
ncbi:uncharacterized protein BT62DRAFT_1004668 [Guyanagaster necrorhizus]|uniref:Uncharacterized protein n=1 Tax=Guyanagaster necrorhizus TaxID=856835 RepID=A0A9P7VTA2_9AGAR|nr:uncharacterized protein BT62DRAFT_1004668 [Guyanagaster necrorhizus MCA 3950]KAG7447091.1 hypothetical protein BT62DRAFT_1004668 [Guyanagaster necrorhizus MCA 3950]